MAPWETSRPHGFVRFFIPGSRQPGVVAVGSTRPCCGRVPGLHLKRLAAESPARLLQGPLMYAQAIHLPHGLITRDHPLITFTPVGNRVQVIHGVIHA